MTTKELDEKLEALFAYRNTAKQSEHDAINSNILTLVNDPLHLTSVVELFGRGRYHLVKWLKTDAQIQMVYDIHREGCLNYYDTKPDNRTPFYHFLKARASDDLRFSRHQVS